MKQVIVDSIGLLSWLTGSSAALPENAQISKLEPITVASDALGHHVHG